MSNSKWDKAFPAGAKAGLQGERKRVIAYLERRAAELKECGKDDTCNDLWHFTQGLIEDITEGEH
jgi:hypothetical protein